MKMISLIALMFVSATSGATVVPTDSITRHQVTLHEVTVTSFKQSKKLSEAPASVSVLSTRDINTKNIVDFKEISAFIPNLYFPDYGSKLTSPLYIRGIGSKINAPSVGLYVDDLPYFEKSVFDVNLSEVNRIEVLRGPQGTLYGRNTMGGIINVYTKNPLDYQGLTYKQSVGNYGQTRFSGSYYGKANDKLGYSFSSQYKHSDGFFVNDYDGSKADRSNEISGRAKLQWKVSSVLEADLFANYQYTDQNGYAYGLINPENGKTENVNYNDRGAYRQGVLTSGLALHFNFDHFLIKSVSGYQNMDDRQAIDQDFTVKPLYFVTQTQKQHLFSQNIEMKSKGDSRYSWLNGVFGFYELSDRQVKVATVQKDYSEPNSGIAVYHQSTLKKLFFDKLSATLGIRFDVERDKQDYHVSKVTDTETKELTHLNDHQSFRQLTPKISFQYQFNPHNMVYATTTKGYKTGGFNTSFSTDEERIFNPESSWNYEVGSHFSFWNDKLYGDFALFYIDWKHQQISHPLVKGSMLTNAGSSYSKGVELSLNSRLNDVLNLQFSYGYTEAKFRTYLYGDDDYSGNRIPFVPNQTLALGVDYTLRLHSRYVDNMVFSTQYVGTGEHYWNEANTAKQGFFGLLNGKISARKKNFTVDLWIKNATSRKYQAFYLHSLGNSFAQKGKPLTFGTSFSVVL
ncbi:TonB-dependent receptor domain-containing protein [uncultured Bacteroides sp.]|uniref:TonB-dependent receptor n=1 Tax=uncultured Bacteroides sp. TaxID=162156 RepID=UPI002AAC02C4|nr:TonB-dependent receptor [uncultured Bacteroides sp.]